MKNASRKEQNLSKEWSSQTSPIEGDFIPGVILLVHLNENSDVDMKNTGLSFWDSWDNWVIEDLMDSGYKNIEKYFYKVEEDLDSGKIKIMADLDSVWQLLYYNPDLRSRVFEKLILETIMRIDEKLP